MTRFFISFSLLVGWCAAPIAQTQHEWDWQPDVSYLCQLPSRCYAELVELRQIAISKTARERAVEIASYGDLQAVRITEFRDRRQVYFAAWYERFEDHGRRRIIVGPVSFTAGHELFGLQVGDRLRLAVSPQACAYRTADHELAVSCWLTDSQLLASNENSPPP